MDNDMTRERAFAIFGCAAVLVLLIEPAVAQIQISNGEDQNIRFGIQAQVWADVQQDQNASAVQGYQENLYLRRIRFLVGGNVTKDVSFFFETDQPNLGKNPKALNSGFLIQDAFFEYKIRNALRLDGGLMIVPFARNALQSTASYYTLDIGSITTVNNSSTQSSALRDLGFQARGFLLDDHLTYRLGVFSGDRASNGRNSLRSAAYLQYDFFSSETGYLFTGTALGKQKILALSGGADTQGAYRALSADVAAAIPVAGGGEVGGQIQYIHYDGRQTLIAIPKQDDILVEAAYYFEPFRVQPFAKFESQGFATLVEESKSWNKWGGGVNYYVHRQNLKFTVQFQRLLPQNLPHKPANEYTAQLQVFYF